MAHSASTEHKASAADPRAAPGDTAERGRKPAEGGGELRAQLEAEVQAEFDAKSEKVLEILESKDAQIRGLESELRTATESSEQRAAELRQV